MKSSRDQFEEWLTSSFGTEPNPGASSRNENGRYFYVRTEKLWQAWQASREALVQEKVTTAPFLKVDNS